MGEHSRLQDNGPHIARVAGAVAWSIGPVFVLVALWLYFLPPRAGIPIGEVVNVPRDAFLPGVVRHRASEPPRSLVGGFEHSCNECHKLFDSPPTERRLLTQHTNIVLRHGMNNRCFNCHDRGNREKLVLTDATLLGFDEVPRLCSQCHGTVFRDWRRGMHGKTMGSWDASSGKQVRLVCNDCHNPHSPAYSPIAPLPGPNTLRMGNQTRDEDEHRHMPLRQRATSDGREDSSEHQSEGQP